MERAGDTTRSADPPRPDTPRRLGILLADSRAVVREGLRRILSVPGDLVIVGEAADGHHAIELVARRRPDVVILDATLPRLGGYETSRRITTAHPDVGVVLFIERLNGDDVRHARAHGALGAIGRDAGADQITAAVAAVAAATEYVDPRAESGGRDPAAVASARLTPREQEILQLLADGYTNREVGARLVLGSETVKTHVTHILTKLDAAHRSQAVAIGLREGLIR
jgi:NarL family two-component system response regulator LiaR